MSGVKNFSEMVQADTGES